MHDSRCMQFSLQPDFGANLFRIENMHHLHITSTSSLETSVFPCKAESDQSCTEASVSHRTHTDKSTCPSPSHKTCILHESPMCVQLANTYSQTGEAPWLSRVSVSMSVLMAVADLTQAPLTDCGLLFTLPPPSCPSLIFTPPPPPPPLTGWSRDARWWGYSMFPSLSSTALQIG